MKIILRQFSKNYLTAISVSNHTLNYFLLSAPPAFFCQGKDDVEIFRNLLPH